MPGNVRQALGALAPLVGFAAVTAIVETTPADVWARLGRQPGFRTLASSRFRRVIGLLLLVAGLVYLAILLAAVTPAGGFEIDFVAGYRRASLDLLEGRSPYLPAQLNGPFPAHGRYGWYLYPPVFAQVLTPLALLPAAVGAILWLLIQALMLFVATWVAASAAGARRSLDRVLWTGVALTFFMPVHEVLWTGNVGGPLALSVGALLLARAGDPGRDSRRALIAGVLAAAAAVIKLAPLAWLPASLRAGGALARGSLLGLAALVVPSLVLVPQAWLDYVRVLLNLVTGDARYANNLAPAIVALNLGLPSSFVDAVRLAAIASTIGLLLVSLRLSRSAHGWPAAVLCAVLAGLLLPAALWYHYLVLLLPLAAFVWVRAALRTRAVLLASGALISVGMTVPPLAAAGAAALAVTLLVGLRPTAQQGATNTAMPIGEPSLA